MTIVICRGCGKEMDIESDGCYQKGSRGSDYYLCYHCDEYDDYWNDLADNRSDENEEETEQ